MVFITGGIVWVLYDLFVVYFIWCLLLEVLYGCIYDLFVVYFIWWFITGGIVWVYL